MKKLILSNYACFEQLSIDLKPGINLLIGDNASGKTTILRAMQTVLSTFFSGYSDENTRFIGIADRDFRLIQTNSSLANEKPVSIEFDFSDCIEYPELLPVETKVPFAKIQRNSKKKRTQTKGIGLYKTYGKTLQEGLFSLAQDKQQKTLPIFAAFSTEDIHSQRKIQSNLFKRYYQKPSFGYYECLLGNGLLPHWHKRLLVLQEGNKSTEEIQGVRSAIQKTLGETGCNIIRDMDIRPLQGKIYYLFIDGREVESQMLSDGFMRLVNIVTDLAFRCMLLNKGILGLEACEQTRGVVLIDEIDLHLHPTLQALVIKSLSQTFKNIQFIITTHAPMVMTGVESNNSNAVYYLNYHTDQGYKINEIQPYGLDASTLLETVLNLKPRAIEVEDELRKLFDFLDEEKTQEAKAMLLLLKEKYQNKLPELTKAETILNFSLANDD